MGHDRSVSIDAGMNSAAGAQIRLRVSRRRVVAIAVAVAIAVPLLTLLVAAPANLTSDESLYLAEAYNIAHGHGLTYPSGEAITHRAPLQPLLLAPAVRIIGGDGAYAVAKAVVVVNVALVAALAWMVAGRLPSAVAAVAAAGSSYLNSLGTTLYVDPLQCTFMLAAMLAMARARRSQPIRWMALAGALAGMAFLVKESAVQWLALGPTAALVVPELRTRAGFAGAAAYAAMFGAVATPWFVWVWWHDRSLYLVGEPDPRMLVAVSMLLVGACAAWVFAYVKVGTPAAGRSWAMAGVALVAAHGAVMLWALTRYSTWPYPNDYLSTVPAYLRTVAPEAQPYPLLVLSWLFVGWLCVRGDSGGRLLALGAVLFAPFALFAAHRGLQLRDALPIVYLSYVVLGVTSASVVTYAQTLVPEQPARAALAILATIAAGLFVVQQALDFRTVNQAAASAGVRFDNWDNAFVDETANWLEANVPEGSRLLASRLYFSSLHVETEGRYEIRQLPTVRVSADPGRAGLLRAESNLFRWGDDELRPSGANERWLYLKRFPGKGYWVGLSEQELLDYISVQGVDYLVLTGDDVAFSSLQLVVYLSGHPAFTLLHHHPSTATDQLFVYAIDRSLLGSAREPSLAIGPADASALERETGLTIERIERALGQPVRVSEANYGLSANEREIALASGTR